MGLGFAEMVAKAGLVVWACSILPEHVHIVVRRHRYRLEQVSNLLQGQATRPLIQEGVHPLAALARAGARPPRAWSSRQWKVFLDSPADILRAIRYVEDNPVKEGLPRQRWSFVRPFTERDVPMG